MNKGKQNNKVLSSDEIDQLLSAIKEGPKEETDKEVSKSKRIKIYDFKRPDVLNIHNVKDVDNIFERVVQGWSRSNFLGKEKSLLVRVVSVDQLRFQEFIRSIPTPTTLYTFNWDKFRCAFEIDPSITFPLLRVDPSKNLFRSPTEKEKKTIIKTVLSPLLKSLRETICTKNIFYDSTLPKPKLDKFFFESETRNCQKMNPDEMVCLVTMECNFIDNFGKHEGFMNFCMEYKLARRLSQLLRNEVVEKEEKKKMNIESIKDTKVEVEGSLGSTKMTLKDVEDLKVGSIIELDKLAGEPTDIIINGKKVGSAEVVIVDESFALRVLSLD